MAERSHIAQKLNFVKIPFFYRRVGKGARKKASYFRVPKLVVLESTFLSLSQNFNRTEKDSLRPLLQRYSSCQVNLCKTKFF